MTGLLLGLAAWVEPDPTGAEALGGAELARPLAKLAPSMMDRLARRAAKRGGHVRRRPPEELHDLRKALKKLRYGSEFLAGLHPRGPAKRHGKAAKRLLKILGAANDATVAVALAGRFGGSGAETELAPAKGALARWSEDRRGAALRK